MGSESSLPVINAYAGRVAGSTGGGVEHEEAAIDPDRSPRGARQLRGRLPVVQVRAVRRSETSTERALVDGDHLDMPGTTGAPLTVPAGVDAVPGLAGHCQPHLGGVGSRLRPVRADPDPIPQGARWYIRDAWLRHLFDAGRESPSHVAGRPPPRRSPRSDRARGGASGSGEVPPAGNERLQGPREGRVGGAPGDLRECHTGLRRADCAVSSRSAGPRSRYRGPTRPGDTSWVTDRAGTAAEAGWVVAVSVATTETRHEGTTSMGAGPVPVFQ
jgi:hypothetical protein